VTQVETGTSARLFVTDISANSAGTLGTEAIEPGPEARIPLHEEELSVDKRVVESGRVVISQATRSHQETVDELLNHQEVEVEHIAFDKPIDSMPSVRQEGDITIVPVVEEVLKIERRLVLKEEVHIRRVQRTERYQNTVTLRKQEAVVSRIGSEEPLISRDRT
jgi:uncharacterized protein (TIGR02271 family)